MFTYGRLTANLATRLQFNLLFIRHVSAEMRCSTRQRWSEAGLSFSAFD
jgi:hypothetical protein